uniref:Uncharacterized protein n=1 Tax=Heliothis virescens TaxID=7102 RepID=A0A2A4JGN3_HELVI
MYVVCSVATLAGVSVTARVLQERAQDALPFRLYLRYYDVPARTCACVDAFQSDLMGEQSDSCSLVEEVETGFEIYFAPDFGVQNDDYYTVSPEVCTLAAGESAEWAVQAREPAAAPGDAPDVHLLLRALPLDCSGPGWRRLEPPPQLVRVRRAVRSGRLKLSCCELRVRLCALDLPYGDVLRVRKRFHAINVGNGVLELGVETQAPWCVLDEREVDAGGGGHGTDCCCTTHAAARLHALPLRLEPNSSIEMCVEVSVSAAEVWPTAAAAAASASQTPVYPPRTVHTTPLHMFDDVNILRTVPLVLDMEFPVLRVLPTVLDFGVVADGDTRKAYFSVSHSSRTVTLDIAAQWIGGKEFKIWPSFLRIPPGGSENVYLQYTAT